MTNDPSLASSTMEKLQHLARQQETWSSLSAADKLSLLQAMKRRIPTYTGYETAAQACVANTMGLALHTAEGQYEQAQEYMMMVAFSSSILDYLIAAYQVFSGQKEAPEFKVRQVVGGRYNQNDGDGQSQAKQQWAVQVFPYLPDEKSGPISHVVAEVYLDPNHVQSATDAKQSFDWRLVQQAGQGPGAAVVLGAGNFSMLTAGNIFACLFRDNRCCLVKHHALRGYLNDFLRFLLQPVAQFVDFETDATFDRTIWRTAPPNVLAAVHMTGGKATHNAIVWGNPTSSSSSRPAKPVLQAKMTSELGCVTPWIVPQCSLTAAELRGQATSIARAVYVNCSFMCNTPKVVIVSHAWSQRDEFIDAIVQYLRTHRTPAAYYPGTRQRWQAFKDHASPECMEISCQMDVTKRQLRAPTGQDEPTLLPWLVNSINVDLTTEAGRAAAAQEYALRHEPFAPVLTICTIQSTSSPAEYLQTAVQLCNEHIFGSLSASLTVPSALQNDPLIDQAISNLRYGAIATNAWSGFPYLMKGLPWGAHPGERLEAVESGIGSINGYCFIPHAVKGVARFPPSGAPDMMMLDSTRDSAKLMRAIAGVTKSPGLPTILYLLWCILWAQIKQLLETMKILKKDYS